MFDTILVEDFDTEDTVLKLGSKQLRTNKSLTNYFIKVGLIEIKNALKSHLI